VTLPKGVKLTSASDKMLSDMSASGRLDCVIIAWPPDSFRNNHPDVVRLFPDFEAMVQDYYEKTRVYPIIHVMALLASVKFSYFPARLTASSWIEASVILARSNDVLRLPAFTSSPSIH
jgi:hypothetical protein